MIIKYTRLNKLSKNKNKVQYIFLSHDVDWSRKGPSKDHILARKERFDPELFDKTPIENLYYNFPEYMEIEDKFNVRSTFFFRTKYETGDFNEYENEIKSLINGGWEIGLHCDPSSVSDIKKLEYEKKALEKLTGIPIRANRVHYLKFNDELPKKLIELGFEYDSSVRNSKDKIDENEMGHYKIDSLIEFPVTLMDAYLFTYMKLSEDEILPTIKKTLDYGRNLDRVNNVITILWHDNVLKMKGGRMYKNILEILTSQDDVKICKGEELVSILK